jgi:integrase
MRRGEVLGLKPEHVNLERVPRSFIVKGDAWVIRPGWLLIEKSKNGKPRTIPMRGRVRRVIERLCSEATAGGYVFESIRTGRKITDVKRGFTSACLEAGIENLTFHDLRHTWSTRAAELGVQEHVRRDIMGHSSQSMTGDYTHATPEAMEDAMERVAHYSVNYGRITAKTRKRQELR